MISFIIRRIAQSIVILIIVSAMVFLAMRLLPGDPIRMLLSQNQQSEITPEQIDLMRHQYGLDKPMVVQYFNWLGSVLHGDLGRSILNHVPVLSTECCA